MQRQPRAMPGEGLGYGFADTARRAGDQDHLSFEIHARVATIDIALR
jgi:hypothetical protein